jgi:hypothetical protein
MRVRSSEAISGFLKVYRLGRSSCWLSEGEEARVEPVRDLWVARAPVTAEDQAALRTDVLAGYVFAQARPGPARPGRRRPPAEAAQALACLLLTGPDARTQADNASCSSATGSATSPGRSRRAPPSAPIWSRATPLRSSRPAARSSSSSAPRPRPASSSCSLARCCSTPGLPRVHGLVNGLG